MRGTFYRMVAVAALFFTTTAAASDGKITFAYVQWKPMTFIDEKGEPKGIFFDIAREIFEKKQGIKLEFLQLPWKRAQRAVENGTADFMVTVPTTARREYAAVGAHPFHAVDMALFTWRGHPRLTQLSRAKSVDDLLGLGVTAITNLGNGWHKQNVEGAGIKTLIAKADENIAIMLGAKRADFMIDSKVSMNRIIKEKNLGAKIIQLNPSIAQIKMTLLVSNKSRWLRHLPEFDRIHGELIADGTTRRIVETYLGNN